MSSFPPPTQISQPSSHLLSFTWPDSSVSVVPLKFLRDECPCAGCKGETILGKHFAPMQLPTLTPGMYEIEKIEPVGKYGLQFYWKDGHNTGIYSWEYLHLLVRQMEGAGRPGGDDAAASPGA